MQKAHQWEMADDAAWSIALQREAVIRPLAEFLRLNVDDIASVANQLGLSRTVLYKLLQRYGRRPQTSSLLPWKRGRKPDQPLLSDEREALLNACITEFYLQPERPSLAALQAEVRRRLMERSLKDASSTGDKVERDALPAIDAFTEELVQLCRKYEVFTVDRDDGESANFTGITQHGAMKWPLRSKEEGRK
jgi:hypothetical protein